MTGKTLSVLRSDIWTIQLHQPKVFLTFLLQIVRSLTCRGYSHTVSETFVYITQLLSRQHGTQAGMGSCTGVSCYDAADILIGQNTKLVSCCTNSHTMMLVSISHAECNVWMKRPALLVKREPRSIQRF